MSNRRVLVLTEYYLPAFKAGGPVRSVANLIAAANVKMDFTVVTSDRDLGDKRPFDEHKVKESIAGRTESVFYIRRSLRNILRLRRIVRAGYDVIYINGIWNWFFNLLPLLLTRARIRVVAPRGMLIPGALQFGSFKKWAVLKALHRGRFLNHVVWHCTSRVESEELRSLGIVNGSSRIVELPNIPSPTRLITDNTSAKRSGFARFVFLSRISPIKNLLGGLRLFAQLDPSSFLLDIYGPIADRPYWKRCENLVLKAGLSDVVTYRGAIPADGVLSILSEYDFLFLPSFSENFGHVILEALSARVPVLIGEDTPWKDTADFGCGFLLDLNDVKRDVHTLNQCIQLTAHHHETMRKRAFDYYRSKNNRSELVQRYAILFLSGAETVAGVREEPPQIPSDPVTTA